MKKITVLIIISIVLISCGSGKQIPLTKDRLDDRLENTLKYERVTGFSVSVFTKDSVLYQNAFGYENIKNKTPFSINTKQHIASISKTVIAVALLKAQELELISLDDPINQHLPFEVNNPYFKDEAITIRHLATHTSSLKYSERMTDSLGYTNPKIELKDVMREYLSKNGKWYNDENFHKEKPGTIGDYSNIGASLAAYIIEYKSGIPFSKFASKYIFNPLDLSNTDFKSEVPTRYYKYLSQSNFEETLMEGNSDGLYPAGALSTNLVELTKFCQMVMNNGMFRATNILKPESVNQMLQASKLKNSLDDEIHKQGIFWSTMKNPLGIPREMIGHNGGDYGIYCMMFFDQKTNVGYILLSNTGLTDDNVISMHNIYKSLWEFSKSK